MKYILILFTLLHLLLIPVASVKPLTTFTNFVAELNSTDIAFTNFVKSVEQTSIDVVLPNTPRLSGFHSNLKPFMGNYIISVIGLDGITSKLGNSAITLWPSANALIIDPGEISPNDSVSGRVLRITIQNQDAVTDWSTFVSNFLDTNYIQTYSNAGWTTRTGFTYYEKKDDEDCEENFECESGTCIGGRCTPTCNDATAINDGSSGSCIYLTDLTCDQWKKGYKDSACCSARI